MWCLFQSSISTRQRTPTNLVDTDIPSDVSKVMLIGEICPVNSLRSLHIIYVDELSTIKGIPSVSQEKELSPLPASTAKTLMWSLGKNLCRFQRCRPWLMKIFKMRFIQRLFRPLKIGYKYTNSISINESIEFRKPLGGSGRSYMKYIYGIAWWRGSS